jgi:hypothetical protein
LACSNNDEYIAELEKKSWIKVILILKYIIQTVLYSVEQSITLGYWIFLYKGYDAPIKWFLSISYHGILGMVLLIDVCVFNRETIYLKHFWMPLMYTFFHDVFEIIYVTSGGQTQSGRPYIYHAQDWNADPGTASIKAISFLFSLALIHFTTWIILVFCRSSSENEQKEEDDEQLYSQPSITIA